MLMIKTAKIRSYEVGLYFRDREFRGLLNPGRHWFIDPLWRVKVDVVSQRQAWFEHPDLDVIVRSGALGDRASVLDLKDRQRALVWIEGRFDRVLGPGLHAFWTGIQDVRVEVVDAESVRFRHQALHAILKTPSAQHLLSLSVIPEGHAGVLFLDGKYVETLGPGQYAFWKDVGQVKLLSVDMRESVLDVTGQEIMTADKVTLRMNAVVTFQVVDAQKSVSAVDDARQALYREAQLALRAVIGTRLLDEILGDKDTVAKELELAVARRSGEFGLRVVALGIRDVILPGDMKELLNKVTEAKKAAEAALITRREETAAMRSQANTAKLLDGSPVLMRLRELEVLEKIAQTSNLSVVLGEKGLADRVVNLL